MRSDTTTRTTKTTLWVTLVALLLVAMTTGAQLRTCLGACQDGAREGRTAQAAASSCCASNEDANEDVASSCCGCCEGSGDSEEGGTGEGEDGAGAPAGGCCVTLAFDVELAPSGAPTELRVGVPAACWVARTAPPMMRAFEQPRPFCFDRGPPRIDGRTALRATQVLLI